MEQKRSTCSTCRYFDDEHCFFNPPVPVVVGMGPQGPMVMGAFAPIKFPGKIWCSHHAPKLEVMS